MKNRYHCAASDFAGWLAPTAGGTPASGAVQADQCESIFVLRFTSTPTGIRDGPDETGLILPRKSEDRCRRFCGVNGRSDSPGDPNYRVDASFEVAKE